MSTKSKLLELLEKQKGSYLSGEELAQQLDISRTAVWKAMKSLRQEGYQIQAVTNKGYALCQENDILSGKLSGVFWKIRRWRYRFFRRFRPPVR